MHGVNDAGKAELVRPAVKCGDLETLIAGLPPCLIGMEACSGAHEWARRLDARVAEYDKHLSTCARQNHDARRLMRLPGIGPVTASALVASVGDGRDFANGRQLAAWLGMVPSQYSSGGKANLFFRKPSASRKT